MFKARIIETNPYLLIDDGSKAKLINQYFVHTQKVNTFKLKKKIN